MLRKRRWLVLGGILMLAFVALLVTQRLLNSQRYASDADLVSELMDAEFLDDPIPVAGSWPQWLGPNRDGVGEVNQMAEKWASRGPRRIWNVSSGQGFSSFSSSSDRLFTMLGLSDGEAVVCLDAKNGQTLWKHQYTPENNYDYGGPRATPTLDGDHVYTVSSAGVLMCLTKDKGEIVWEKSLRAELNAQGPRWGFAFSPLIVGDMLYAIAGGSWGRCLAAFKKQDGALLWAKHGGSAGYASPISLSANGVEQVVFFTAQEVRGLNAQTGDLLWRFAWPTSFGVNAATPTIMRAKVKGQELSYVFLSSGYEQGSAMLKIEGMGQGGFRARAVYTTNQLCCHFASGVRYKDHLYALDEKRDLTCLNLRTGEVAWRFGKSENEAEADGANLALRNQGFKKGSLIRVGDRLIVLGEEGKLALVKATPTAYEEISAHRASRQRCWSLPIISGTRLVLRDERQMQCFELSTK